MWGRPRIWIANGQSLPLDLDSELTACGMEKEEDGMRIFVEKGGNDREGGYCTFRLAVFAQEGWVADNSVCSGFHFRYSMKPSHQLICLHQ